MSKRIRKIRANITWAFKENTPFDRDLCSQCQIFDGPQCPRHRDLNVKYKSTMIATRCRFFTIQR